MKFIGTAGCKVILVAYDYRCNAFVFCLCKGPVYESWSERRFIRCGNNQKIVQVCRQKLRFTLFNIPANKFIFAGNKGKNLPLLIFKGFVFYDNNVTRSKRIVIAFYILKDLALNRTVTRYAVVTFDFKYIFTSA